MESHKEKLNVQHDFPLLQQKVHGNKPLVYLDTAASTPQPTAVIDAVDDYVRHHHANVHRGVHTLSERATALYEGARIKVQKFIAAQHAKEIIFSRGATAAINLVAQSYGQENLSPGDEILISALEHHANIVPWQMLAKKTGALIKVIPLQKDLQLDQQVYFDLLNPRTKIVAITHVSNVLGVVNPLAEMIAKAHHVGAKVLVDGAQAVSHMRVDVQALDVDFYVFSAHKMYGPTGIGVLYGKQELLSKMPPVEGGGDMIRTVSFQESTYAPLPHKFEAGTPPIASAIGLAAAIDYLQAMSYQAIAAHIKDLTQYAYDQLSAAPGVRVFGSAKGQSAVVSFLIEEVHPHDVGTILDSCGVAVRAGHHCAMPLMDLLQCAATVRASFGVFNSRNDIDALLSAISTVQRIFKKENAKEGLDV